MTDSLDLDQKYYDRDTVFRRLYRAMSPYFVGPIPPKEFLDSFLPKDPHVPFSSTFEPGILSGMKDTDSEADMYTKFVRPNAHHGHDVLFSRLIYSSPKSFTHASHATQV